MMLCDGLSQNGLMGSWEPKFGIYTHINQIMQNKKKSILARKSHGSCFYDISTHTINHFGLFWYTLILTRSSPMTFFIGRGFAELQILKKWKWTEYFAYTLILTRFSPIDCQMSFGFGQGFAEVQILKKWTWPYLLNLLVYFDNILHTHFYWQGRLIAKCHSSSHRRDCQMSFGVGLGFAEVQNLKKVKLALSLEPIGIFW